MSTPFPNTIAPTTATCTATVVEISCNTRWVTPYTRSDYHRDEPPRDCTEVLRIILMPPELLISRIATWSVIACWFGFVIAFVVRRKPAGGNGHERKRDRHAVLGIVLEAAGFAVVWFRRSGPIFLDGSGTVITGVICLAAVLLAASSVILIVWAINTLGKQWAVAARVLEDHTLVTTGPYRFVRNPIYAGMFGLLLATGPAWGTWWGLLIGAVVFWIGTRMRIGVEEKLLREAFGDEFDDYVRRVPALVPSMFGSR